VRRRPGAGKPRGTPAVRRGAHGESWPRRRRRGAIISVRLETEEELEGARGDRGEDLPPAEIQAFQQIAFQAVFYLTLVIYT